MPSSRLRRTIAVIHRVWIALGITVFIVFTGWSLLAYRANGEARASMTSDSRVTVTDGGGACWIFRPANRRTTGPGLVFFPGAMVDSVAYAPLARRVAEAGYPVVLVRVPRRAVFGGAEGVAPFVRARAGMREAGATRWVVAGHSRGAEIAGRMLAQDPTDLQGLVLIGSSHPRDISLAHVPVPVTRVYGTRDTVADVDKLEATRHNLPTGAHWIRIDGGNHSQFGYYGFQPGDWPATISREDQQAITLAALLDALAQAGCPGC